jgi:hypothetical protein
LGTLIPDFNASEVYGSGVIIDQGLNPTASPPIEQPVVNFATNEYVGVYGTDTLNITPIENSDEKRKIKANQ